MMKEKFMELALTLARSTVGQTRPNPAVGAVVVKHGRIVGMGSHLKAGEDHAEVIAIKQAKSEAEGSDVYVTLEPCAHYGKTPPCAELLINSHVRKVYIACVDPNPRVAGKGIEKLRSAGIEVELGVLEQEALALNRAFFYYMKHKRPYVTIKAAMTLDGKIATASGNSQWITSEQARADVHYQRAIHDAILVGSQTVKHDNPQLTARTPQGGTNPIRVILDTHLAVSADRNILDDEAPTWLVCGRQANADQFQRKYPHIKIIQTDTDKPNLADVLALLGEQGIQSLYVEGGSTVHHSFLASRLFQECHWYIAPKLIGGNDAIPVIGGTSPENMSDALDLTIESLTQLGPDIKVVARPKEGMD